MPIEDDFCIIYGNINIGQPSLTLPLNVINFQANMAVVVGPVDNKRKRIFLQRNYENNLSSFQLDGSDLFIGFNAVTNELKLTLADEKWELVPDGTETLVFVHGSNRSLCWDMNNNTVDSPIIISNFSGTSTPKQKWIFVRVRTVDPNLT